MATTISTQDIVDAKRDIEDIGKAVNEKVIVSPRYGDDFKSLPMIADEAQTTIGEWESAIALITQEGGVPALAVSDVSGNTQQEINDARVVVVGSISDLLALPEGQRKEGLRYLVKGFYADSDTGGRDFFWVSSKPKSAHNGLTIIDPVTASTWSGTQEDLSELYRAGGEGYGCFVAADQSCVSFSQAGIAESGVKEQNAVAFAAFLAAKITKVPVDVHARFSPSEYVIDDADYHVTFLGSGGSISIREGITDGFVLVRNAKRITFQEVVVNPDSDISSSAGLLVDTVSNDHYVDILEFIGCTMKKVRCLLSNNTEVDHSIQKVGFGRVTYTRNNLDLILNGVIRHMHLSGACFDLVEITDNYIRHFDSILFSIDGRENGALTPDSEYCNKIVYKGNSIKFDDDFFITAENGTSTTYHTPLLAFSRECVYSGNTMYGVKTYIATTLYDGYLSCDTVTHSNNNYINNFNLNPNSTYHTLIKAKGGSPGAVIMYTDNLYEIDDDYLDRVGVSSSEVKHSLMDSEIGQGDVTLIVRGNTFKLKGYGRPSDGPNHLELVGNNFRFDYLSTGADGLIRIDGAADMVRIQNNTWECTSPVQLAFDYDVGGSGTTIIKDEHLSNISVRYLTRGTLPYVRGVFILDRLVDCDERPTMQYSLREHFRGIYGKIQTRQVVDSTLGRMVVPRIYGPSSYLIDSELVSNSNMHVGVAIFGADTANEPMIEKPLYFEVRFSQALPTISSDTESGRASCAIKFRLDPVLVEGDNHHTISILDTSDQVKTLRVDALEGDSTSIKVHDHQGVDGMLSTATFVTRSGIPTIQFGSAIVGRSHWVVKVDVREG